MKRLLVMMVALLAVVGAGAETFLYLNVKKAGGQEVSIDAAGAKIVFADGNLVATSATGTEVMVPLSAVESMEFSNTSAGAGKVGDLNHDGEVNVGDVTFLINAILTGNTEMNKDVNGDGEVNVADATSLINIILTAGAQSIKALADGQAMWVATGNVKWAYTTDQLGVMTFNSGSEITILGKTYAIAEIGGIDVNADVVANNNNFTTYAGATAEVVVAGNIADKITAQVTGADVTVTQAADVAKEYSYTLSGQSTNGSFTQNGDYKSTLVFNGLNLTSTTGAAVTISNSKRIAVVLTAGTVNTLTDATGGKQKAALYFTGHPEFEGAGTLNVTGCTKHAICAKEYLQLKKTVGEINILGAESDGIHCGEGKQDNENNYFQMNGGVVTMSGVKGDCIDSDDYGCVVLKGGTLNLTVDAEDVVGVKADSLLTMSGGNVNITLSGASSKGFRVSHTATFSAGKIVVNATGNGTKPISGQRYTLAADPTKTTFNGGYLNFEGTDVEITSTGTNIIVNTDTTKCFAIKCDADLKQTAGNIVITCNGKDVNALSVDGNASLLGGGLDVTCTGDASKGVKVDGNMVVGETGSEGPNIVVGTSGKKASAPSTGASAAGGWRPPSGGETGSGGSPKAVKVMGVFTMKSGYVEVATSSEGGEGIESKNTMYFDGGDVVAYCYDDCINCTGKIYVRGARLWCISNGNDAIDSNANSTGSFQISDGVCVAITSKGGAEMGIDADGNNHLTLTGGYVFTGGGNQGGSSTSIGTGTTAGWYWLTGKSFNASNYYTLTNASGTALFTVKLPVAVSSSYSLISAPGMVKNSSYTIKYGTAAPVGATDVFEGGANGVGFYKGGSTTNTSSLATFTSK